MFFKCRIDIQRVYIEYDFMKETQNGILDGILFSQAYYFDIYVVTQNF